jgi:23S rRNA pseudouridine2605 synthase
MARPRKSSTGKTSFGKRSDAEKSFHNRKKEKPEGRFGSERPRSAGSKFSRKDDAQPPRFGRSKPSFGNRDGDAGDRPRSFSKPFGRGEGAEKPFQKKSGPFGSGPEGPSRFAKKPFQKRDSEGGESKPFRRSDSRSFGSKPEGPSRFGKKPFSGTRQEGEDKPFRKRSSFGTKSDGPSGFTKKPFQKRDSDRGDEKPFRRSDSRSFSSRPEGPPRFAKKPFPKPDSDRPDNESAPKRESRSFDSRSERSSGFAKKPFARKEGSEKPFRKSESFESKPEGEDKPFRKSGGNYGLPYKRKPFDKARDIKSTKRAKDEEKPKSDSDLIRLNKFIANSGVGSRREADELIKMGLVTVNGVTITEMGHKVKITDEVRYEGKKLKAEKPVYILLNKPKGFITTTDDPQERNTVMNLVASAGKERIYPVGRLDRNTTGLLLLTNDGDLADKLTHPSYNVKKIYRVELDKPLTKNDFIKIKEGVHLEEGKAMVDDLAVVGDDNKIIGIELHIGWNRIVRRIFESQGYEVVKLDRVAYAGLDKKDLARGQWRFLKPEEIITLKHFK